MGTFGSVEQVRPNRIRITTEPDRIRDAISAVQDRLGCDRLVTVSTVDNTGIFELIYHLTGPHSTIISLVTRLSRPSPEIRTVSDILPPAGIYERQIHDLFGIVFSGHPGLKRLMLNEDWPESEFPLRKDWKPEPGRFYGGIRDDGGRS
jgi:NADH:ubiquinone oxidoreductase subunit C